MQFMIVDDDEAIRFMLEDIIEDYDLGKVAASLDSAVSIDNNLLKLNKIDILIIDMLMPVRDGIQTVKVVKKDFAGKIIMLSQVENKELVGNAYALGVDYYITKPINRNEVVSVIHTVSEHIRLKNLVSDIETNLHTVLRSNKVQIPNPAPQRLSSVEHGEAILRDLGINSEIGSQDLLAILRWLEKNVSNEPDNFPCLKVIFTALAKERNSKDVQKELKAIEQRLRRTIFQAMVNIASMGMVDYTNPKFEDYTACYFDFAEIRGLIRRLENDEKPCISQVHINSKKFIRTFFIESTNNR